MFYHGRHFHSASIGSRLVEVICERCGCEYLYELARVGSGSETAPYGIGSKAAARSADEQAKRDLNRRLADEAELVPCPKCQWINGDLVSGYRRGRYRRWSRFAAGLGIVGTVGSLIGAWYLSIGPAADRDALPYFLIGGPVVFLGIAGSILLSVSLFRKRIQPNRDYPLSPKLPPGSPRPLIRNQSTGELEPVAVTAGPDPMIGAWIDYQVGRSELPAICCECLAPSEPRSAYRRPLQPAVELVVPLCSGCARRWTRRGWLGALAAIVVLAAVSLPVLILLKLDEIIFWMAVFCLFTFGPAIMAMIAGQAGAPVRVKEVDGARGVVLLWFRNEDFKKQVSKG